jgi:opacity protein-like surface antigen
MTYIAFLAIMLSGESFAGTMGSDSSWERKECPTGQNCTSYPWAKVLSFSIGPAWSNNGKTQTFYLQQDIQKTYSATFHSNILPYGALFLGAQKQIQPSIFAQFGIEVAGGGEAKLRGDIYEDADPAFNNYRYTYGVTELRVALKTKLLVDIDYYGTMPYLTGAVGLGVNKSSGFAITSKIYEEVPAPDFASNTTKVLTFAFGIGLQESLTDNLKASIGYEFADWGKSQLTRASGQTQNDGLIINNLYINSVLISLSYLK